jgi:hypothetical protein
MVRKFAQTLLTAIFRLTPKYAQTLDGRREDMDIATTCSPGLRSNVTQDGMIKHDECNHPVL